MPAITNTYRVLYCVGKAGHIAVRLGRSYTWRFFYFLVFFSRTIFTNWL